MMDSFSAPIEGIGRVTERFDYYAAAVASGRVEAREMVGTIESRRELEANVAVMRAADEMIGTLLDDLA